MQLPPPLPKAENPRNNPPPGVSFTTGMSTTETSASTVPPLPTPSAVEVNGDGSWVRKAFWAWLLVFISLLLVIGTFSSFVSGVEAGRIPFNNPARILQFLMPTGIPALLAGFVGTFLGWSTLMTLRRANGQRRGLWGGVVGALTWPLLLFTIFGVFMPTIMLVQALDLNFGPGAPMFFMGALILSCLLNILFFYLVARWAASLKRAKAALEPGEKLRIRHKPLLVALAAFLQLAAAFIFNVVYINLRLEKQREERNQMWNAPVPEFNDPQPTTVVPAEPPPPPPLGPAQPSRALEPGQSLEASQTLFPSATAASQIRVTFWSNGVPVDLPELSASGNWGETAKAGLESQWTLRAENEPGQLTLSGPGLLPGTAGAQRLLRVDPGVEFMAVPTNPEGVHVRDVGPMRQWLFLSGADIRAGIRLNAVWGVSVDVLGPPQP